MSSEFIANTTVIEGAVPALFPVVELQARNEQRARADAVHSQHLRLRQGQIPAVESQARGQIHYHWYPVMHMDNATETK